MVRSFRRLVRAALGLVCLLGAAVNAHAQAASPAEALRQEGEALLVGNRFKEACPKLAESYRLDPATGTLLGLGMCHEGEGKLATAWMEFVEVASRSPREGRDDRAKVARERADALQPRLSYVLIQLGPQTVGLPGLEVTQDGTRVDPATFGKPVPVDPGDHVVEVSAPGKARWKKAYTIGPGAAQQTISVPTLAAPNAGPMTAEAATSAPPAEPSRPGLTDLQLAGLVTAGVGVVGIVVGSVSGLDAMRKQHDTDPQCNDLNQCSTPSAVRERREAVHAAGLATVTIVTGSLFVVGGATMFFLGGRTKPADVGRVSARPTVYAGAAVYPGGGSVNLSGRF
jgi:hypothetical protein